MDIAELCLLARQTVAAHGPQKEFFNQSQLSHPVWK